MGPILESTVMDRLFFAHENLINKIKIESITTTDEIGCIMDLFLYLQYLEVSMKSRIPIVVTALTFILRNHSMNMPNLTYVRFISMVSKYMTLF